MVQGVGGGVGLRDSCDYAMDVLVAKQGEQFCVKLCADSLADDVGTAGDADFDRGLVGGLEAEASSGGVTEQARVCVFGHQRAVSLAVGVFMKPSDPLLGGEWVDVEGDVRVLDVVIQKFGQARQIV